MCQKQVPRASFQYPTNINCSLPRMQAQVICQSVKAAQQTQIFLKTKENIFLSQFFNLKMVARLEESEY